MHSFYLIKPAPTVCTNQRVEFSVTSSYLEPYQFKSTFKYSTPRQGPTPQRQ